MPANNNKEDKIKAKFNDLKEQIKPKPKYFKNILMAFIVGGAICTIGEVIFSILLYFNIAEENVKIWMPIIMIFLGALLTGTGTYAKIATFAGAGTVVPITGFSNAMVSPAIEFKKEGFVFGVAAKMFTIAGPVLVYGISSSVIIGIVYYILKYFSLI